MRLKRSYEASPRSEAGEIPVLSVEARRAAAERFRRRVHDVLDPRRELNHLWRQKQNDPPWRAVQTLKLWIKSESDQALYPRPRRQRPSNRLAAYDAAVAVAASRQEPPEVLRQELQTARARGIDWETAWRTATARSLRGVDREEEGPWRDAYAWSNQFWRDAYIGVAWDACGRPIYPD